MPPEPETRGDIPLVVLGTASSHPSRDDNVSSARSIPPPDTGKQAYLFLAACMVVEVLVWGFSFAFGILQAAYETGPFRGQAGVAAIGTTASGVIYLSAPLAFGGFTYWTRSQRYWPVIGTVLMVAAILASSWANTVPQLVATQGLVYALGCTLVYTPSIYFLDQWFLERKGLAFGMMCASTGIGGVVLPFSLNAALSAYSYRVVLRGYSIILFLTLMPLLYFIRPRVPSQASSPSEFAFLRSPLFALYQLGNIIQGLGFFLPSLFLPTYVRALGGTASQATVSVVLVNIASVVGCVTLGWLVDRLHVTTCIAISTGGSTIATLVLWGVATDIPTIYAFAVVYGIFAGSFSSTWPGIMRLVLRQWPRTSSTMAFAFLAAGRGLGNVLSGPVSQYLVHDRGTLTRPSRGYSSSYMPMIIFTGISAFLGGISVFTRLSIRDFRVRGQTPITIGFPVSM